MEVAGDNPGQAGKKKLDIKNEIEELPTPTTTTTTDKMITWVFRLLRGRSRRRAVLEDGEVEERDHRAHYSGM
jgi:hypothetical protein